MNNPYGAGEAQLHGPVRDFQRIVRIFHAAAQHGVDIHLKHGILRQHHQPAIQCFQAFLGDFVRHHVINADLQMLQPRFVQPLNAFLVQIEAVGD